MALLPLASPRLRPSLCSATAVAALTVRIDLLGVTSIVRALKLQPRFYNKPLEHFHTRAVKLDRLSALWTQAVLRLFPAPLRGQGPLLLGGARYHGGQNGRESAGG